jgi:hypothetical protein
MKKQDVTMVNPQQIVNKGLKGCGNTRTVMAFAQKHGVPCVWYSPNRNQKVLLVDWPQFRTTWNQYWSQDFDTNWIPAPRTTRTGYASRATNRYATTRTTTSNYGSTTRNQYRNPSNKTTYTRPGTTKNTTRTNPRTATARTRRTRSY